MSGMFLAIFPLPISDPHTLYARSVFSSTFLHEPLFPVNTEVVTISAVILFFTSFFPLAFIVLLAPLFVTRLAITCFEAGVFTDFPICIFFIIEMTVFAVCLPALLVVPVHNRITLIMRASSNFKVVRANAWWIIAKMTNFQPISNRTV